MKEQIILTGSCYWCMEAIFQKIKGVTTVESGLYYINSYDFSFSDKDRLEAIRIEYDTDILSLTTLFEIFYLTHNPTLIKWDKDDCFYPLCRSSVIYFTEAQKLAIETKILQDTTNHKYEDIVQTKIAPYKENNFFLAGEKDNNYYINNPNDGYCLSIIDPKMEKLNHDFKDYIKQ